MTRENGAIIFCKEGCSRRGACVGTVTGTEGDSLPANFFTLSEKDLGNIDLPDSIVVDEDGNRSWPLPEGITIEDVANCTGPVARHKMHPWELLTKEGRRLARAQECGAAAVALTRLTEEVRTQRAYVQEQVPPVQDLD